VRRTKPIGAAAAACAALVAGGCEGKQDVKEPGGNYPVEVTQASFARSQHIDQPAHMRIVVRNAGSKTVPTVAATIGMVGKGTVAAAFAQTNTQTGLQSRSRPIWVVDRGPRGGDTAFTNTWALKTLKPGKSVTLKWDVTPVMPGHYVLSYRIAAGLYGKARAVLPGGGVPHGTFPVTIARAPRQAKVADNGSVVPGRIP
jgi:hypothetical protein